MLPSDEFERFMIAMQHELAGQQIVLQFSKTRIIPKNSL